MFCKNCGNALDNNAKFCSSCGVELEKSFIPFQQTTPAVNGKNFGALSALIVIISVLILIAITNLPLLHFSIGSIYSNSGEDPTVYTIDWLGENNMPLYYEEEILPAVKLWCTFIASFTFAAIVFTFIKRYNWGLISIIANLIAMLCLMGQTGSLWHEYDTSIYSKYYTGNATGLNICIISSIALIVLFFIAIYARNNKSKEINQYADKTQVSPSTCTDELHKQKIARINDLRLEAEERAKREAEQLSISDIESAASAFLNRRVSISDIACTLIYVIPKSTGKPKEMHLDMYAGDQEFTSLDLFFDQQRNAYFFKGRQLALDGAWRSEEEIFGFNVSLFKKFTTEVDEDE